MATFEKKLNLLSVYLVITLHQRYCIAMAYSFIPGSFMQTCLVFQGLFEPSKSLSKQVETSEANAFNLKDLCSGFPLIMENFENFFQ